MIGVRAAGRMAKSTWPSVALVIAVLAAWQWASGRWIPAMWVSDPARVADRLATWSRDGTLWTNSGTTLLTTALGYAIGAAIGIAIGLVLGLFPRLRSAVSPIVDGLFCLPKIALLPLLVVLLGVDMSSKVVLVASVVVFLLLASTVDGVRNVELAFVDTLAVMGATRGEIVRKLIVPAARPWIYVGLRGAVSYAFTTAIVGELLSSNRGLGFLIESSAARFDATGVFAAVVIVVVLSVAMTEGLTAFERRSGATDGR
jgi:NitT/TauT family transport system permease protein